MLAFVIRFVGSLARIKGIVYCRFCKKHPFKIHPEQKFVLAYTQIVPIWIK